MKKLHLSLLLASVSVSAFSQTLFTYGNNAVSKEEFLRAYNKNKVAVDNKEKALRDYLDLYTKFKLKVKAATDLRLDTLEALKADVISFRNQIQDGYMTDEKGVATLINEAFDRSQKDLHVVHFFIALDQKATNQDTTTAAEEANDVYDQLKGGKTDYVDIVKKASSKALPIVYNDLGFITAFSVPYSFENIIYGVRPGNVGKPFRTRSGYHIFKVVEERKSAGRWRVAQILFAYPPGGTEESNKAVKATADLYYDQMLKGADFAELAKQHSEDKLTYLNGGEMPEFGSGKYDIGFENEVFKLKKDGEISKPFASPFGYHIVKRIAQIPTPSDKNDPAFMYEIKQRVMQNERANTARDIFVKAVIKQMGYKKSALVKDTELFRYADSMSEASTPESIKKLPVSNKVIFSFGKDNVKGADWLNFVKDYKHSDLYKSESYKEMLNKYVEITALEFYKKRLEEFSPEFNFQIQEFKEGNMLFEIMERNVWSTAAVDTVGLQKQYNQNKAKYVWPESANAVVFSAATGKVAEDAIAALKTGKSWKEIAEASDGKIQADSGRYELNQLPIPAGTTATAGYISKPSTSPTDGSATFVKVLKVYPANQQRSFDEAKGLVINDYQIAIEDKWINELKKKYPVKINEVVFDSLLK